MLLISLPNRRQPPVRVGTTGHLLFPEMHAVLVHADDGRVDHLNGGIMGSGERVHDPAPDTGPSPTNEPVVQVV